MKKKNQPTATPKPIAGFCGWRPGIVAGCLAAILFLACPAGKSFAQATPAGSGTGVSVSQNETDDFLSMLPPLETLIDSALAHAPELKGQEVAIRMSRLDMRHAKNKWTTDIINAGGVVNYGKLNDLYLSNNSPNSSVAATSSSQTRYSVGVSVKIPITTFFDKYDYKSASLELEQTQSKMQGMIREIREKVMDRYNNLLANYHAYMILFETFDDQEVLMQTAENDFLTNQISIAELSGVRISFANAKIDINRAKFEFQRSLWMLEETVGFRIRD